HPIARIHDEHQRDDRKPSHDFIAWPLKRFEPATDEQGGAERREWNTASEEEGPLAITAGIQRPHHEKENTQGKKDEPECGEGLASTAGDASKAVFSGSGSAFHRTERQVGRGQRHIDRARRAMSSAAGTRKS